MIDEDDVFYIKQHDLEPPLEIDVSGSSGDLTGVDSWTVTGSRNGVEVFSGTGEFTPGSTPQTGTVKYAWQTGDTDTIGSMDVEAVAMWPGDRPQTFPPKKYCRVMVSKSLG